MTTEENAPAASSAPARFPVEAWTTAGVLALAVLVSFFPNVLYLTSMWDNPNYSHGYLVTPIALAILWIHRRELARAPVRPNPLGWLALAVLLGVRLVAYQRNDLWIEAALIPLVVASLTLALGGWPVFRAALPALAFLLFLLPLPGRFNEILAGPLQRVATVGSTFLLQIMGLPVLAEGNVIVVGADRLEVARACNGLSMLSSFVTLIVATELTVARGRPLWERAVLLLSTIPIALAANILRIAATAWAYHLLGSERGEQIAHDLSGFAMMPVALALIWLEMSLFHWLVVEEDLVPARQMLFVPTTASGPQVAKKN